MLQPPDRLDLKIGFACNNHCDFCAQGGKRRVLAKKSLEDIVSELKHAAGKGVRSVVFTGGEPTLHPSILDAVKAAKSVGFEAIQIQTNGRRFAYLDFCQELAQAGVNEFSPSIHGSCPEIHDEQTRAPDSWKQVVAGIRNLRSLGLHVLTNTVVTSRNYADLPKLARLLVSLGVDQFQFAFVHIVGTAAEKKLSIVPKKSKAVPKMLEGLRVGLDAGIRCYTEAVPYCLLPGFENCASELIIPDGPIVDADVTLESWRRHRIEHGKSKRKECRDCRYDDVCEGPWKEYPELYGWDEFVPIGFRDERLSRE